MTESKKHHYVPQSLLKNFEYESSQIFVFDKKEKVIFPSSIINAGSENYFNTVIQNGERLNFESIFQKNDDDLSFLLKKIIAQKNTHCLSLEEKEKFLNIVVVQLIRTKMYRTTMISVSEQLKRQMVVPGWDLDLEVLTDNDARESAFSSYKDYKSHMSAINGKVCFLIQSNTNEDFIISDNPITRHNTFPYGGVGLSSHGVEIYFPISPKLTFALYCPTIINKMNDYVMFQAESTTKSLYINVLEGIISGKPVTLGETTSGFLNSLQVINSSRFLYANSKSIFSKANTILKIRPALTEVKTQTIVGKMGEPPRSNKMPNGEWAVIHSEFDHHMFPIFDISKIVSNFEFSIERNADIEYLLEHINIKEISLFESGLEISHRKDVKLEFNLKDNGELRVTVLHKLDFLNKITLSKRKV